MVLGESYVLYVVELGTAAHTLRSHPTFSLCVFAPLRETWESILVRLRLTAKRNIIQRRLRERSTSHTKAKDRRELPPAGLQFIQPDVNALDGIRVTESPCNG